MYNIYNQIKHVKHAMYSKVRIKRTPMFINYWNFFQGLRLFFMSNFPEATIFQGAMSISDSGVRTYFSWPAFQC
jgi:hypothetical protein